MALVRQGFRHPVDRVVAHSLGMNALDPLLSVQDLAAYLDLPVATLYAWRYRGQGPSGFRVGRHVRYRQSDVDRWIDNQLASSGSSTLVTGLGPE